jgi:acetate kinase
MILVINCGSSSLKFQVVGENSSVKGLIERIGSSEATLTLNGAKSNIAALDHFQAFQSILPFLPIPQITAVGHRVVHGGEKFSSAVLITPELLTTLEELSPLAPLHNPANLQGIKAALEVLPNLPMVAVFDTAFHSSLPPKAYLYALPNTMYQDHQIRRYGFHGTSHQYVSAQAAELLNTPLERLKIISLHLGNGASACAIQNGQSVDTSMGFTPLEGLVMGTRSGDLDPSIVLWLVEHYGLARTTQMLNKESGLLGLSGVSNDIRDLRKSNEPWAKHALEVMTYRLTKQIGSYAAALGGVDVLIFTGGAGENDVVLRSETLRGLEFLGLELDETKNNTRGQIEISKQAARAKILVIPTDEEGMIAKATLEVLGL